MRRTVKLALLVLLLVGGSALVLCLMGKIRASQDRAVCQNHLRMLALGVLNYGQEEGAFPAGTVFSKHLPPEKRFSWYVEAWSFVGDGQVLLSIERTKPWDAPENVDPKVLYGGSDDDDPLRAYSVRNPNWLCPANPARAAPGATALTHYVGIAGLGADAATLKRDYPYAGFFGYDPSAVVGDECPMSLGICREDITDGVSTTLMVVETARANGPWTAGGPATVRGLDPNGPGYLGVNGQFGGTHPGGTMAVFADASVRFLGDSLDPKVFEALSTIAGGENVGWVGAE